MHNLQHSELKLMDDLHQMDRSDFQSASFGPAKKLYAVEKSLSRDNAFSEIRLKEDSVAITIKSGRISEERTIFKDGLMDYFERTDEASYIIDQP